MNIFQFIGKYRPTLRRLDKHKLNIGEYEIIAFSCVRNEMLRLPYFLEYHRNLGVDRFIFIDNASTDGTKQYLLSQKDTHVFYTKASYAGSHCGMDWIHQLLSEFGENHWILTLDPDELLVYPKCEFINLKVLTEYLDSIGAQAMMTFLLDMYSDKAIKEVSYEMGESFLDACSYYDSDSYYQYNGHNIPTKGGPRDRLFWKGHGREKTSPYLINIPLIKWRKDLKYESGTHSIFNVNIAPLVGAKQHFKLFSDFYEYVRTEVKRKEHWDDACEYTIYWDILSKAPGLSCLYEGSLNYSNSMQLVELGLMKQPDDFVDFVDKCPESEIR